MTEAQQLLDAGRVDEARQLLEAQMARFANHAPLRAALATVYGLSGRTQEAAVQARMALDLDLRHPDYLRLKPLVQVRQWHPLGAAVYHKALARIALYEQDYDMARQHVDFARQFSEDDPELPVLESQISLSRLSNIPGNWFKDYDERSRQRRLRKSLPADPTLADCLALLSKGDMVGICRVVDSGVRVSGYRVAEVRQYLQERLTAPGFVAGMVVDLNDRERAALRDLLGHGGVMPRAEFTATYGEEDERPYLEYHAATMTSVSGCLRARGLLFEGTSAGQVVVAIPRELRLLLAPALA